MKAIINIAELLNVASFQMSCLSIQILLTQLNSNIVALDHCIAPGRGGGG